MNDHRMVPFAAKKSVANGSASLRGRLFCALVLAGIAVNPVGAQTVKYYYTDQAGTVLAETDATGTITSASERRPYGARALGDASPGPGMTGHVDDPDSGLVYMQARYYDPELGRFLSTDPDPVKAGDIFSFARMLYVNANPVGNVDPDGRECVTTGGENGKGGCWTTPEERRLADRGDWKGYYDLAGGKGHDPYAKRAGEVANESGSTPFLSLLTTVTTMRLTWSIESRIPAYPGKPDRVASLMQDIRVDLARAHVAQLEHGTPQNPVQMTRQQVKDFHDRVFKANEAGSVFGGVTWDKVPLGRLVYEWCPAPSCSD